MGHSGLNNWLRKFIALYLTPQTATYSHSQTNQSSSNAPNYLYGLSLYNILCFQPAKVDHSNLDYKIDSLFM